MSCRRVQNRLSEYIDGELSPAERARVFAHLRECPDCRAEEAALRRTASLAQTWGLHPAAPELEWRLSPEFLSERARLPERVPWSVRLKVALAPASVAAAALLLMLGSGSPLRPVPPVVESDAPAQVARVAPEPAPLVLSPAVPAAEAPAKPVVSRPTESAPRMAVKRAPARRSATVAHRASERRRMAARTAAAARRAHAAETVAVRAAKPKAPEPIVAAETLYASGRYREAAVVLNAAIEQSSMRVPAQQRSTYVERNALADATIAECTGALLQDPGNANARKFLDEAYSSKVALLRSLAG